MATEYIPHDYQQRGIDLCIENDKLALFLDPGLGKTSIALSVAKHFRKRTLIIAPLDICYRTWPREIRKWDFSKNIKFTILHGPNKEARFLRNFGIYLINPEGLKWLLKVAQVHKRWPFSILIVDESLIFKNHKSKRFDYLTQILPSFDRRYIMTGTPIPKSYMDLWGQTYILDKGKRLYNSFWKYRSKYFYPTDFKQYNWELLPFAEVEIQNKIADISYRVAGNDHLNLPEIVTNDVFIELPSKARKHYREMQTKLQTEFDSGLITTAINAATKIAKLQTIANGFSYIVQKDFVTNKPIRIGEETIHEAKLDALEHIINELNGNPVLVGFHYKYDLKMLLKRFPKTPYFGSGIEQRAKYFLEKRWNNGKIPVLFAQIGATALGLNLQEAGYNIVYYHITWDYLHYDQFIKRVARQGQKSKRVIVHRLIAQNTIDDEITIPKLENREMTQNEFLNAMKQHTANKFY